MNNPTVSKLTLSTARNMVNSAASLVYAMALDFNARATTDKGFFDTYNKALVNDLEGALELKSVRMYATAARKLSEKYADIVREERTRDGDELTAAKRDALAARINDMLKARQFGTGVNALSAFLDGKLSATEQAAKDAADKAADEARQKQERAAANREAAKTLRALIKDKDTNGADRATLKAMLDSVDSGELQAADALKLYNEVESTAAKAAKDAATAAEKAAAQQNAQIPDAGAAQVYDQDRTQSAPPVLPTIVVKFGADSLDVALSSVTADMLREAELLAMAATMDAPEAEELDEIAA
jgi:hypothetical protein